MLSKTKSVAIMIIILMVIVIAGFVVILIRKQSATIAGETVAIKSSFGMPGLKKKAPQDPAPANEKKDD